MYQQEKDEICSRNAKHISASKLSQILSENWVKIKSKSVQTCKAAAAAFPAISFSIQNIHFSLA